MKISEETETIEENNEEIIENTDVEEKKEKKRMIVIPGEIIVSGKNYLPSEGTRKEGDDIIAGKFGLAEISERLVKVISLSGAYIPRVGNTIIGRVTDITFSGWMIDINAPYSSFLSTKESNMRYGDREDLEDVYGIGDLVVCKIFSVKRKSVDLTTRIRGLGKLKDGIVIVINSNKVPRVIGKEGSMINLIKQETNCNITVGQNGIIWIKGEKVEDEIKAKSSIMFIAEKSFIEGLTDEVQKFLKEYKIK
jgi:exosome complex component RRP4